MFAAWTVGALALSISASDSPPFPFTSCKKTRDAPMSRHSSNARSRKCRTG